MDTKLTWEEAGKGSRAAKFGAYGGPGTGKTTTMAALAAVIAKKLKKTEVYMIDSEGGADYVASLFDPFGVKLRVIRTREFGILVKVISEMHNSDEVLLIDSTTHFSDDVIKAYLTKKNKSRLELQDFSVIYESWREFSRPFVTSHLNAIVCGRLGNVYETTVNEEGKVEFYKADTKFRASDQFGHEPDFLLEMSQDEVLVKQELQKAKNKQQRARAAAQKLAQPVSRIVATVRKDRTRLLMGEQFIFEPTPDTAKLVKAIENAFSPVIDWHLQRSTTSGLVEQGSTEAMFASDDGSWRRNERLKKIATEEIEGDLVSAFPGNTKEEKKAKADILQVALGSRSWTAICDFHPDNLREGRVIVKYLCEQVLKYATEIPEAMQTGFVDWLEAKKFGLKKAELDDDIPNFKVPENGGEKQGSLV